jgi:Divergent InlB B-repeat domain
VVKRVRLAICVLVVALGAVFAPSALAGLGTVSIGASTGNGSGVGRGDIGGSVTIPGFFNCAITPTSTSGSCVDFDPGLGDTYYIFFTPSAGSALQGISGCPGFVSLATRSCSFTITNLAQTVVVRPNFVVVSNIAVTGTKTGQGTFQSASGVFNCGVNCTTQTVNLTAGSQVQITATPAAGWTIGDWGGACNAVANSSNVCTFTVGSTSTSFSLAFVQLSTLTINVIGSGTVGVTPGNITCPPTCTANVVGGTTLTFTATPASGFHLVGFSGPCSGTTCSFTMTQATTLTVTFAPNAVQANVNNRFVTYNGPAGRERVINTKITAHEQITVEITVRRGGTTIASRQFSMNGVQTLKIFLRNGLPAGTYTVIVNMENQSGQTKHPNNKSLNVRSV